jgi:hypothetical protein
MAHDVKIRTQASDPPRWYCRITQCVCVYSLGTQHAVQLLMTKAPLSYESIVIWRYDMVPMVPMQKDGGGCHEWNDFTDVASEQFLWFEDDWAYSFPGWFANCVVGIFLHHCMDNELHCLWAIKANWPKGMHNLANSGGGHQQYYLYRTDYDQVSTMLNDRIAPLQTAWMLASCRSAGKSARFSTNSAGRPAYRHRKLGQAHALRSGPCLRMLRASTECPSINASLPLLLSNTTTSQERRFM